MDNRKNEAAELVTFANRRISTQGGATYTETSGNVPGKATGSLGSAIDALGSDAFYSGSRFLGETVGPLPKDFLKKTGKKRVAVEHYLASIVSLTPNEYNDANALWETAISHAVMYGNGYVWIERLGSKVIGLHNVHALLVRIEIINGSKFYFVRYQEGTETKERKVAYADMLHIRNWSEDGIEGFNVVDRLAMSLSLPQRMDAFVDKFFEQGAAVNVVVEANTKLNKEDVDVLRYGIDANHSGIENAHKAMILSNATAKNLSSPLKDFAFDILNQSSVDKICRLLRIPPHILYSLNKSNYNSLEWLGTELVTHSILPWVLRLETQVNAKLISPEDRANGVYFKVNVDGLMRGDKKTRAEVGVLLYTNSLITKNEFRALEDLEPDEADGDKYLRMLNMKLGNALDSAQYALVTGVVAQYKDGLVDEDGAKALLADAEVDPQTIAALIKTKAEAPVVADQAPEAPAGEAPAVPVAQTEAAAPLNGAQIQSALEVIVQQRAGVLTPVAAEALLVAVGLPAATAKLMVGSTSDAGPLETVTDSTPAAPVVEEAPTEAPAADAPVEAAKLVVAETFADAEVVPSSATSEDSDSGEEQPEEVTPSSATSEDSVELPAEDAPVAAAEGSGSSEDSEDVPAEEAPVEEAPAVEVESSSTEEPEEEAAKAPLSEQFGKFLAYAKNQVTKKQTKAFSNAAKKAPEELQAWVTKFAEEQGSYLADALNPFVETVCADAGLLAIVLQGIAERYAKEVEDKKEEADPQVIIDWVLQKLSGETGNGQNQV